MDLAAVLQRLNERGMKLTPQRVEIVKILMDANEPVTAQEVAQAVRTIHPHVSLDTVYRNLTMLIECGLVNQVNLQNRESTRFEFQGNSGHHHHCVCLGCGKSFCVESCPTAWFNPKPTEDPGFKVMGHAFEVYGYCTACQA